MVYSPCKIFSKNLRGHLRKRPLNDPYNIKTLLDLTLKNQMSSNLILYPGKKATQYWYCPTPSDQLKGVVNGRYTYWASKHPIPGGIACENFELTEPFEAGKSYVFGITPLTPEELIKQIEQ